MNVAIYEKRIKIFAEANIEALEKEVNEFIRNDSLKDVEIQFRVDDEYVYAMVYYLAPLEV